MLTSLADVADWRGVALGYLGGIGHESRRLVRAITVLDAMRRSLETAVKTGKMAA